MLKSKVLLPSDGSETSIKAAAYAIRLMKMNPGINLTVIVVIPESVGLIDKKDKDNNIYKEFDEAMETKGREILQNTIRMFSDEGLEVDGIIEKGDPAMIIVEHAEKDKYEHIIMGSRGVSELRGVAIGSVSHRVIHLANCRVTLVK